jgi:hypothetical protein
VQVPSRLIVSRDTHLETCPRDSSADFGNDGIIASLSRVGHFFVDRWIRTRVERRPGGRSRSANAGCTKIFCEQVSSVAEQQQPEAALEFVREGDTFKRLAVFACSPMYVSRVNANVILLAMEGNMPENPNPQRLMLTPGVHARLTEVNRLEPEMAALSDDELRRKTDGLKARLRAGTPRVGGQP